MNYFVEKISYYDKIILAAMAYRKSIFIGGVSMSFRTEYMQDLMSRVEKNHPAQPEFHQIGRAHV